VKALQRPSTGTSRTWRSRAKSASRTSKPLGQKALSVGFAAFGFPVARDYNEAMLTHSDPIFAAALALPVERRKELAAKLIESLDEGYGPPDNRTPEDWARIIMERSDAIHRGETVSIDGQIVADKLQAIIDQAGANS
jgi:hypothetical protein